MRGSTILLGLLLSALPLGSGSLKAAPPQWTSEQDPGLGFTYSYPRDVFSRIEGDGKPSFHYFESNSSEAKFLVGGWDNAAGQSPETFKRWVIENVGGYDELTYRPRGRSWFVLSGYRGNTIYYEKVMFSCQGKLVNVFAVTYPVDRRHIYDPVVERIEDTFRPGRRCTS